MMILLHLKQYLQIVLILRYQVVLLIIKISHIYQLPTILTGEPYCILNRNRKNSPTFLKIVYNITNFILTIVADFTSQVKEIHARLTILIAYK